MCRGGYIKYCVFKACEIKRRMKRLNASQLPFLHVYLVAQGPGLRIF